MKNFEYNEVNLSVPRTSLLLSFTVIDYLQVVCNINENVTIIKIDHKMAAGLYFIKERLQCFGP